MWNFSENFENDLTLDAIVIGPENSAYEGGLFRFTITIPIDYPLKFPKFKLLTPLYHPVSNKIYEPEAHSLCAHCLNNEWSPIWYIKRTLNHFRESLLNFETENMNNECCDRLMKTQLLTDPEGFTAGAKRINRLHARYNNI